MTIFKVLPHSSRLTDESKAFGALNKALTKYVPGEVDLLEMGQVFGGINKQYLSLHHLSLNPGVALKRMGCENTEELFKATSYACGFLGDGVAARHALVPLGVVVNDGVPGLKRYHQAFDTHAKDGTSSDVLHLVSDGNRFGPEVLQNSFSDDGSLNYEVTRFEQLFLGSGFTREMLADAKRQSHTVLRPVGVNLSNGDTLLAYAYKLETYEAN